MDFDAVILAGGRAARLDGADKPGAEVGGRALIAWVAEAAGAAARLIVVGPRRTEVPGALTVLEDPPGAGPVAALRAGLDAVHARWVALLAADLPFLTGADVAALFRAADARPGAVLVDGAGQEQWLAGVWQVPGLRAALAGYEGRSLRGVLGPLGPVRLAPGAGSRPPWFDCDTPEELARARRLAVPGTTGVRQRPDAEGAEDA